MKYFINILPGCAGKIQHAAYWWPAGCCAARGAASAAAPGTGHRTHTSRCFHSPRCSSLLRAQAYQGEQVTCLQPSWIADASFSSPPAVLFRAESLQYYVIKIFFLPSNGRYMTNIYTYLHHLFEQLVGLLYSLLCLTVDC